MPEMIRHARRTFVRVKPGEEDRFLTQMKRNVYPRLSKEKGIRRIYLLHDVNKPTDFVSLTLWDSKREADAYESKGHFATYRDSVAERLQEPPIVAQFNVEYHTVSPSLPAPNLGKKRERINRSKR